MLRVSAYAYQISLSENDRLISRRTALADKAGTVSGCLAGDPEGGTGSGPWERENRMLLLLLFGVVVMCGGGDGDGTVGRGRVLFVSSSSPS